MAFINKVGSKISELGHGVVKQTKDFTGVARLNSAISAGERKIAKLYATIGENYYNAHKDDEQNEQSELIAQVNDLFSEIEATRKQIDKIKGIGKCPVCGAEVGKGYAFCSSCGHKLEEDERPQ